MKKTIGYVLAEFPVLSETFVGTEMRAMQAAGHRVVPCTIAPASKAFQPADQALQEITCYTSAVSIRSAFLAVCRHVVRMPLLTGFLIRQRGLTLRSLLLQAARLVVLVERHGINHLHAHFALAAAAAAIVAARLKGISVSFVGHGFDIYATPVDLALKLAAADFAVAVCEQTRTDLLALSPETRMVTVPCGVDMKRFPFCEPRELSRQQFLFIGRFCEKKGINTLLEAFSRVVSHHDAYLDLVGDGPMMASMKAFAQQLGVEGRCRFLGPLPTEWIIENGRHYTALVAPFCIAGDGDRDTGPLVIKEAMALGLPVIASDLMGCREMIAQGTGWKVPSGSVDAFSDAMNACLAMNLQDRKNLVSAARCHVENSFSAARSALLLSNAIETIR